MNVLFGKQRNTMCNALQIQVGLWLHGGSSLEAPPYLLLWHFIENKNWNRTLFLRVLKTLKTKHALVLKVCFCHGQDPKDWPWPPITLFFLLLLFSALQAWHEAKTSYYMHNTTRSPNIFTYSGPPIKWPLVGLIKGAPHSPDPPPMGGGQNLF